MTVKITYFVLGTTIDNEKEISSGWFDAELSEQGMRQSTDLRNQIMRRKFDIIFCSDLKRAVDSAQFAFGGIVPIIHDIRLRECNYGKYNALPSSVVEPMQEKMIQDKFPDGESYGDVETRIRSFPDFLKQNYDGKSIAIVAHKGGGQQRQLLQPLRRLSTFVISLFCAIIHRVFYI